MEFFNIIKNIMLSIVTRVVMQVVILLLSIHIAFLLVYSKFDAQSSKNYYPTACTVLKKQMVYAALGMAEKTNQEEMYSAKYDVRYVVNNVQYNAVATDALYSEGSKDEINQEMQKYTINNTYPCWYDVTDSSRVVFHKKNIVSLLILEIAALVLLILIPLIRRLFSLFAKR